MQVISASISPRVSHLIEALIAREGGYVNDAKDRGGPTKYGITLATLHEWRKTPVSAADVEAMGQSEAWAIYAYKYFAQPGFDAVQDPGIQEFLFDFGVNSGVGTAVIALQTVLQHAGLYDGPLDGSIGPKTRAAMAQVKNLPAFFFALKCERYEVLLRDVGHRSADAKFAEGWANRLDGFPGSLQ